MAYFKFSKKVLKREDKIYGKWKSIHKYKYKRDGTDNYAKWTQWTKTKMYDECMYIYKYNTKLQKFANNS